MDKSLFFELVLISVVVLWILYQLGKYIGRNKGNKATLKRLEQHLHTLTPDEKTYLVSFVINNENIQYSKIENGVLEALEKKKIIYKSSSDNNSNLRQAYKLQPWAKEYLSKNPQLLD